jgi:DNA-binding NarL/FixJ family response regulator
MTRITVLIADDHPFTLNGTKSFVTELGYTVVGLCSSGKRALEEIRSKKPDIAVLDINMPELDGITVLEKTFNAGLSTKIILLTMHKELSLYRKASEFSIFGYVLKEHAITELKNCLEMVAKGERYLSESLRSELIQDTNEEYENEIQKLSFAERKVIELIAQNKTSKEIGNLLFISDKTVENHRTNIIRKLNLPKEKNALLTWALKNRVNKLSIPQHRP